MLAARAMALRLLARSGSLGLQQTLRTCRHERMLAAGAQAFHASSSQPAAGRRGGVRPSKTAAKEEGGCLIAQSCNLVTRPINCELSHSLECHTYCCCLPACTPLFPCLPAHHPGTACPHLDAAKLFQEIARQMSRLTEKQLARLEPLVGEEVVAATAQASRISHRNQGRQRQEGLVARLLRESLLEDAEVAQLRVRPRFQAVAPFATPLPPALKPALPARPQAWLPPLLCTALLAGSTARSPAQQPAVCLPACPCRRPCPHSTHAPLQAAIESVQTGQGIIANPAAQQQMELWMHALLAGQADAATQVFGLAQARGADLQQLRQLLRQAQQTEPVPASVPGLEQAEGSDGGPAAEAPAAAAPAAMRPTAKARTARKQLRKLLQPLAEAAVAGDEEEEG